MLVQRWRPLRRRGNNYITSTSSAVCTFCSSLAKHCLAAEIHSSTCNVDCFYCLAAEIHSSTCNVDCFSDFLEVFRVA
jgi:sulfatase maturation enzyme AslB (radical SAM superfamily)